MIKIALVFARDVRTLVNTFHLWRNGVWTLSNMIEAAGIAKTWWDTYYKLCVPTAVSLVQVQARHYQPLSPTAFDLPVSPPIPGTRAGAPEGGNVTTTLSFRSGLAGRAYRGRMYAPGLIEADVNDNDTIVSTELGSLATAAANLLTAFLPNNSAVHIFHRPGPVPLPRDNTSTAVQSYVIENIIDSQRRRLPGRGR